MTTIVEKAQKERLPSGWQWAKLGDVAKYINGKAFKPEEWQTEGIPIIRIQNLTSRDVAFNYFKGNLDSKYEVLDGDLLISWSASLDSYLWDRGPAALNQHIFKVVEDESKIRRDYLYFAVKSVLSEMLMQTHGATMKHITRPKFLATQIPLPPPETQQRMAALLTEQMAAVERARVAAEVQLEAAGKLARANYWAVFTDIEASDWDSVSLDSVCSLLPAKSIATDGDTEVRAITTACLSELGFRPEGIKTANMRAADVREATVLRNEILVARSNTPELVGRVALFPGSPANVVASDLTIRLEARGVSAAYLTAYLRYLYLTGYWKERAGGASGTMKKITRRQLLAGKVPLPPSDVQEAIVSKLDRQTDIAKRSVQSLGEQLFFIDTLPSSLLHKAFARSTDL